MLANYVLALLRNDKPRAELRELCNSDLEDFLKAGILIIIIVGLNLIWINLSKFLIISETKQFVAKLFDVLSDVENKRYDKLLDEHEVEQEREDSERSHKHSRHDSPDAPGTPTHDRRDDEEHDGDGHKRRRDSEDEDDERRHDKRYREREDRERHEDRERPDDRRTK